MSSSSKNQKKHRHHGGDGGSGGGVPPPSQKQKPPHSSSSSDQQQKQSPLAATTTATPNNNNSIPDPSSSSSPKPPIPHHPILPPLDAPPPPPAYGFHMLDRRTIVLADGSVRSYFALPPDHTFIPRPDLGGGGAFGHDSRQHFPNPHLPPHLPPPGGGGGRFSPESFRDPLPIGRGGDYWSSLGLDGPNSLKRKHGEEDDYTRRFGQHVGLLPYGNPGLDYMGRPVGSPLYRDRLDDDGRVPKNAGLGGASPSHEDRLLVRGDGVPPAAFDVDPHALKRAFLRFSKSINESASQRKNYLEDGKHSRLSCLACGRASKEFTDLHGLIMHTYGSQNADLRVDHLGLHKALCVLMGWNYTIAPDDSKAYQSFSANEAAINKEDLIMWPPNVIIHNTITGRRKDSRMEGIGNKEMDNKLKELGFSGGKSKAMYGKEGHLGMTIVKFANSQTGLKEAELLAEFFEKHGHGRRGWARAEAYQSGVDGDHNPALFEVDEKTGEKKSIFYGYLATASDLGKVEFDIRKKAVIKSRREFDPSE